MQLVGHGLRPIVIVEGRWNPVSERRSSSEVGLSHQIFWWGSQITQARRLTDCADVNGSNDGGSFT